jgi:hypothetical protein
MGSHDGIRRHGQLADLSVTWNKVCGKGSGPKNSECRLKTDGMGGKTAVVQSEGQNSGLESSPYQL